MGRTSLLIGITRDAAAIHEILKATLSLQKLGYFTIIIIIIIYICFTICALSCESIYVVLSSLAPIINHQAQLYIY